MCRGARRLRAPGCSPGSMRDRAGGGAWLHQDSRSRRWSREAVGSSTAGFTVVGTGDVWL